MSTFKGSRHDDRHSGSERFMFGGKGDDFLTHIGAKAASLSGERGDDRLHGGDGSDFIAGGRDNDRLIGEAGNDVLDGGRGRDFLRGGHGPDALTGGKGRDVFSFKFDFGSGGDVVTDFQPGRDKIAIPEVPAGATAFYDEISGLLIYDPGDGSRPQFLALLAPGLDIDSGDFLIG